VHSAWGVGEAAEDRRISGLERETGEVGGQRRDGSIGGRPAAQRRAEGGDSGRHRRGKGAVAVSLEVDTGDLQVDSDQFFGGLSARMSIRGSGCLRPQLSLSISDNILGINASEK
jgi:hypothetical protein